MGKPITKCQSCGYAPLVPELFLGWLPAVNTFRRQTDLMSVENRYPAEVVRCPGCSLVQLGYEADALSVFPTDYAYRSGTTKALRDNFAQLSEEIWTDYPATRKGVAVDVGCNDGTLLFEFQSLGYQVYGIEPTNAVQDARAKGIPCHRGYFTPDVVSEVKLVAGVADIVTACNVFAHIPDPNRAVECVLRLLAPDGVFVSESHYLHDLLDQRQYDTVYHEHLRYYSLRSLKALLERHGLEVFRAKRISTHGGSIRVYAARTGKYPVDGSVEDILYQEMLKGEDWEGFRSAVHLSRLQLLDALNVVRRQGERVYAIGAPSRAVTLANFCGLTRELVECVCEVPGSPKVGGRLPGTDIPVVDEANLYREQPKYALLLSWHLSGELIPKLKEKGYRGVFIVPLPAVRFAR